MRSPSAFVCFFIPRRISWTVDLQFQFFSCLSYAAILAYLDSRIVDLVVKRMSYPITDLISM